MVVFHPRMGNGRNQPNSRPATIADVAATAGVGIGTVSRVLNESSQVTAATRQRVRAAIETLGYTPQRTSRSRPQRNGFVGVLVPFFDEPSSYHRIRGIVHALQPHGLEIVLYNVDDPDRARNRLFEIPRHNLDGLIIVSLPLLEADGYRLADARFPTVLVDTLHAALPSVVIDDVHVCRRTGPQPLRFCFVESPRGGLSPGARSGRFARARRVRSIRPALSRIVSTSVI
jgi:DNA-binding LacI/PurR family transcriptional regulator